MSWPYSQDRKGLKMTLKTKLNLLFCLIIFPFAFIFAISTSFISLKKGSTNTFCGSCHLMKSHYEGLVEPKSQYLSAKHYRLREKQEDQCATCHVNYRWLGPLEARWRGAKHLLTYYLDPKLREEKLKLKEPYPNNNCLHCHIDRKNFENSKAHEPVLCEIKINEISCISCHGPMHPKGDGGKSKNE